MTRFRPARWACLLLACAMLLGQAPGSAPTSATAPGTPGTPGTPAAPSPGVSALSTIPTGAKVAIIPLHEEISPYKLNSIRRRIEQAIDRGADVIVIELKTPGGELYTSLQMSKLIKEVKKPTIAWVNDHAYSAGALIASACQQIVMAPASTIGDVAPINMFGNLSPTERDKLLDPLLTQFFDNARTNGYDYATFEAMCTHGPELYLIENPTTGKRVAVNQIDRAIMVDGEDPGSVMSRIEQGLQQLFKSDHFRAPKQRVAQPGDEGKWQLVTHVGKVYFPKGQVHNGQGLLTLNNEEALAVGLAASDTIRTDADLKNFLSAGEMFRIEEHWSEFPAWVLSTPIVRSLLILIFLITGFIELQSPGIGWAGGIAAVALIALIGAPFMVGIAQVWHLLLVLVGIVLIFIEVFVTPGFGVLGISGIVCILAGLVLAVVPTDGGAFSLPGPEAMGRLQASVLWTLLAVIVSGITIGFLMRYYGQVPILNRLVLQSPASGRPVGPVSGAEETGRGGAVAVGDEGRVVMPCRPSGRAQFADRVIDVVAVAGFIDEGAKVRVVEASEYRVVVDAVDAA